MTNLLFTVTEASRLLKTNRNYVYKLIESKQLKVLKLGSLKIRKEELERFINESEGLDLSDPFDVKVV
ncbi:helix-turn-helix domain-containing protein [Fusobacterium sp. IOR10]|uniref:helix-turn-helix domain-containing protein n=1 Tax=Fusobacterium sp. IOR10 TaxID=2665157 RepID=UPI0013D75D36|nr:helix-turn-helix domain-containing protein [Fusobacterium sp. IOR10]